MHIYIYISQMQRMAHIPEAAQQYKKHQVDLPKKFSTLPPKKSARKVSAFNSQWVCSLWSAPLHHHVTRIVGSLLIHLIHSEVSTSSLNSLNSQDTIIKSLKDSDVSLRRRALDVIYSMCDSNNSELVVGELLDYLQVCVWGGGGGGGGGGCGGGGVWGGGGGGG